MDKSDLWKGNRAVPVVTVDNNTGKVLMIGYMNRDAYEHTMKTHRMWYYDAKSNKISMKGAHSGNTQRIMSIKADIHYNSLLAKVEQKGKVYNKGEGYDTYFINDIFKRSDEQHSRRKKFGKVDVDEDFDFSKDDYSD